MPACPQCQTAVEQGQRFCPNCGARQPDSTAAPPDAANQPGATVLLPPSPAAAPTARLDPPPPPPAYGLPPSIPPAAQTPTLPSSPPPPSSYTLPAGVPPSPQPVQGKTRWGLILGIIGGILVLGCIAVSVAGYVIYQRAQAVVADIGSITPGTFDTPEATSETEATVEAPTPVADTGTVLFDDDFESSSGSPFNESSDESSTFAIEDGVYVQTVHKNNYFVWSYAGESFGDAVVDIDATLEGPDGGAAALLFRYQDENNFYIWRVYGNGSYNLERYVDDEKTELIENTDSSAINATGQRNHLRVETVGNSIKLFVNDQLIGSTSDPSFNNGDVALGVSAEDDAEVTVRYDGLFVREIP